MTDTDPSSGAPDPRDADGDPLRAAAETMRAVRDRCVWTQRIDNRALVAWRARVHRRLAASASQEVSV